MITLNWFRTVTVTMPLGTTLDVVCIRDYDQALRKNRIRFLATYGDMCGANKEWLPDPTWGSAILNAVVKVQDGPFTDEEFIAATSPEEMVELVKGFRDSMEENATLREQIQASPKLRKGL